MLVVAVKTWREFEERLQEITSQRSDLENQRSPFYVSPFLFRGQSDAEWKLSTTLERYVPNPNGREAIQRYYERIFAIKGQIETFAQQKWSIPTPTDWLNSLKDKECLALTGLPGYEYWIYLRHHGFPSPLLDWTRSPYVAAFFAFRTTQTDKVAIFAYLQYAGQPERYVKEQPHIEALGQNVRAHPRHFLQQSDYSVCSVLENSEWYFAHHESVDSTGSQTRLWKFEIPAEERLSVLALLDKFNLNAFSLFGSQESLMESIAIKEFVFHNAGLR
jgi:hypothetical protein